MYFPVRIYYEDTDAGTVVYHARYLHFFERARTEFLREIGFSQQHLLQENIAFVVKKIDIDYHIPARLDDLLRVETQIMLLKSATIVFRQTLCRDTLCLSEATVTVACVDLNKMKAVAMPKAIRLALQAVK